MTLKVKRYPAGQCIGQYDAGRGVALIPVFQFGVFSDSDLSYFAGPNFNFAGRVHTNGNLFLAEGNGNNLILDDKVTAVKEILRDRLANNFLTNANYTGEVYVLNKNHGCDGNVATAIASAYCLKFSVPLASWSGGIPAAGTQTNVATWTNTSTTVSPTLRRMDRQQHLDGSATADASVRARRQRLGAADCDCSESSVGRSSDIGNGIIA